MTRHLLWTGALLLFCASPALADIEDESDRCSYNRVEYPEGAELCQNGNLVRCEDGAWSDIGDCPDQAPDDPNSEGGDAQR
jgi:hypothetical protein